MTAIRAETWRRLAAAPRAARWLGLAAAPTFAVMALVTSVTGAGADMMCAAGRDASPLHGMAAMYLLMSAFHLSPWLQLAGRAKRPAPAASRGSPG